MGLLNQARGDAGNIAAEFLGDRAHSVIMTKSGARGNPLNLAQMAACVGQQSVRQDRIHRGFIDRTLPHFKIKDLSPPARGFVLNSYRTGLTPTEFSFHAMGGREGLVDTAVRTSSSGYMQRRLVNALQDMVVENDLTVRTSEKNIIQFKYGDDGIDPAHSDGGDIISFEQIILKTKAYRDLLKDEKRIAESLNGETHPEFPVEYVIEDTGASKSVSTKSKSKVKPEKEEIIAETPKIKEKVVEKKAVKKVVEKKTTKKTTKKKTTAKKKEEPPIEKIKKKVDLSKKSFESLSIEEKFELYNQETTKKAIVRGRKTKIFKDWESEKQNK